MRTRQAMMAGLLAVLVAPLGAQAQTPKVVVFAERGFPYFGANQGVSPRIIAQVIESLGLPAQLADSDALPAALADEATRCLVWCYGNTFPRDCAPAIEAFHRRGGCIVAAGVPFTHPCIREEVGSRLFWRDQGHQDFGGHDRIGVGQVAAFVPRDQARLTTAPDPAFTLSAMREGVEPTDLTVPAGIGGMFALGRGGLDPADRIRGVIAVADDAGDKGYPVAVLEHGCARFRGAVDVWAGTEWLSDPRDPAEILLARQALLRGVVCALSRAGHLGPVQSAIATSRLNRWCEAHRQPERRAAPYRGGTRGRLLPRCGAVHPETTVVVHPVDADDQATRTALACLQGHVNRGNPRLYLIYSHHDRQWLADYQARGYVGKTEEVAGAEAVFRRFADCVQGAVLVEERYLNAGLALASLERGVVCADEAQAQRLGLRVLDDLRGRWHSDVEAYKWAFTELWPRMNHGVLCSGHPRRSPQQTDYLIAQRVFTFFISGGVDGGDEGADPVEETRFAEELFAAAEPNTAVLGWWGWNDPPTGIGEYWGMTLASRYAKVTIGTEFLTNMSFHGGIPAPAPLSQARLDQSPAPAWDPTKTYVALAVLDSGNDPWYWLRPQREVWEAPGRGQVPVGWIIGPALLDLAPGAAQWYYDRAAPRDEFICALSGLGYMDVPEYGTAYDDRDAVLRDYLEMTRLYLGRLDARAVQTYHGSWGEPSDYTQTGDLSRFAEALPGLRVLLPDIGRHDATDYARSHTLLPGYRGRGQVPVFHCLTRWIPWTYASDFAGRREAAEVAGLVAQVREQTPARRPAFMLAFALSWTFRPEMINQAAAELGPDYVFVSPSELAALYLQAQR